MTKLLTVKDHKGTVRSVPEEKERLAKIIVFRYPITCSTMKGLRGSRGTHFEEMRGASSLLVWRIPEKVSLLVV